MKPIALTIKLSLMAILAIPAITLAQTQNSSGGGILPGSPFYFLDRLGETLKEFFTFDSRAKVRLKIEIANERITEMKLILETKGAESPDLNEARSLLKENLEKTEMIITKEKSKGEEVDDLIKEIDEIKMEKDEIEAEIENEDDDEALELKDETEDELEKELEDKIKNLDFHSSSSFKASSTKPSVNSISNSSSSSNSDLNKELDGLQTDLKQNEAEINQMDQELQQLEKELLDLEGQI